MPAQTNGLVPSVVPLVNLAAQAGNTPFTQDRQGAQATSDVHGRFYNQTLGGQVFTQTTSPLGAALPLYTTTAIGAASISGLPLWNTSSNRNVVLVSTRVAWVSGTAGIGSVFLMGRSGMGYTAGTGSPFAVFLTTTPRNGILGGGNASLISSYGGIAAASATLTTLGAVADILEVIGSINLEASTATPQPTTVLETKYDGGLIIPPGAAVWLACTVASVALFTITQKWYEAPIPS